ncbi:MAG: glycosyltransferase family 2 protein [Lachnospiraceae bacterium]|nr:glycosyltransferase family 2 protein [Lachnospiraceae bacterium]
MKEKSKFDVSVIIPIYNNEHELASTLNALNRQTMKKSRYEVIIVDDGSSQDMRLFINKKAPADMNIQYYFQEDKGFRPGTARNMGIRNAMGEICLFLDSGVMPVRSCLQTHYNAHKEGPEVVFGYVYGMGETLDLKLLKEIISLNTIEESILILKEKGMMDRRDPLYDEFGDDISKWPVPWVALWTLHFSVKTAFLRDNNIYFDEYFTTYGCEDNDFAINLNNNKARFIFSREAESIHYPPEKTQLERLVSDITFRKNFCRNIDYVAQKYPHDKGVQLWHEMGMYKANKFYHTIDTDLSIREIPERNYQAEIIVKIRDGAGNIVAEEAKDNFIPYFEEFEKFGFRTAYGNLEAVINESGKEVFDNAISKYMKYILDNRK